MIYADFCWNCPVCKKLNFEDCADEDEFYRCKGCTRKFYLTFSVEVEEIAQYDEEADHTASVNMMEIAISEDKGETWTRKMVNTRDLNPETAQIKDGDWIESQNGEIWEVYLNAERKRLQTRNLGNKVELAR